MAANQDSSFILLNFAPSPDPTIDEWLRPGIRMCFWKLLLFHVVALFLMSSGKIKQLDISYKSLKI